MTAIRDLAYMTSRDYAALWELAQRQSVACVVDHSWPGNPDKPCRDICRTIAAEGFVRVSARGTGYAEGETPERFAASCRRANLEWIVPPGRDLVSEIAEEVEKRYLRALGVARESPHLKTLAIVRALKSLRDWIAALTAVDPEAGES